jgi:twinkle protein
MKNKCIEKGYSVEQQKQIIARDPCTNPACGSSNAMNVYKKVNGKIDASCFVCGHYEPNPPGWVDKESSSNVNLRSPTPSMTPLSAKITNEEVLEDFKTYPLRSLITRGLTKETCEKYGVRVSLSPTDGETVLSHMYPYYRNDKLTGYKERICATKTMFSKGDCKGASLFGTHCHKANQKWLFITEGECDAMALYQALHSLSDLVDWHPAVVSLAHGSASAAKDIATDLDYVNSFQKVVLVFDQDDAGQAAVEDACKLLSGKVYIATLSEKDPNDMLLKGKAEEMKWDVLKHCKKFMPDSIVNYGDCWDRYQTNRSRVSYPFPDSCAILNEKVYGARDGELITITSGTGMGKTQWMRELRDHYHRTTDFHFADIALEEDVGDSIEGMVELYVNKRCSLPDVHVTPEEEREAFDFYFSEGRWHGLDYFGGLDDGNLFSKLRWYAANNVKMIFLDHLSIIVSEYAADGDERQRIDTIMTKLAKIAKELSIIIFLIVHLVKTSGTSVAFEEGATPSLDDLRGSGSLKQLSSTVIALSRNQQHTDPLCANTSKLTVLKCRFTGRTGTADYLYFNEQTGRMTPISKPLNYEPEKGSKGSSYRQAF